jgi:hypothetical protein
MTISMIDMIEVRQTAGDAVSVLFWGAHPSRVLAKASRFRELLKAKPSFKEISKETSFRRDAETHTRDGCAPQSALIRVESCAILVPVL